MNSSGTNAVKTTAERSNLRNLVQIGMLGAVSVVLMMFEIPLFFAPSFYKIDLSEIPVLIGTFAMGPVAGMFIELIKVVLHMLFKGSSTAGVGDFANFLIGCAMIVPAGLIYGSSAIIRYYCYIPCTSTLLQATACHIFHTLYVLSFLICY